MTKRRRLPRSNRWGARNEGEAPMTGSKESSMSMSAFQAATKRLRAAFPEIWKAVYAEERVARGLPPSPASPEERAARGREIAIRRVMQLPPEDRAAVIAALQQEDQS